MYSAILDPKLTIILFSILVKRLGGTVRIEQTDIDEIAYGRLGEEGFEDGSLEFTVVDKRKQS